MKLVLQCSWEEGRADFRIYINIGQCRMEGLPRVGVLQSDPALLRSPTVRKAGLEFTTKLFLWTSGYADGVLLLPCDRYSLCSC